jgi:hypothetical protein
MRLPCSGLASLRSCKPVDSALVLRALLAPTSAPWERLCPPEEHRRSQLVIRTGVHMSAAEGGPEEGGGKMRT